MNEKIIGIFVCMLLIATSIPIVSSIDKNIEKKSNIEFISDEIIMDDDCGCGSNRDNIARNPNRIKYYKPANQKDAFPRPTIMEDLPDYFSWKDYQGKDWMTSAKNQLWPHPCGSCWAHGALASLESIINIREDNPDLDMDLSEQYLLSCLPRAGDCYMGGWPYKAYFYIMSNRSTGNGCNGIIPEFCFPYQAIDAQGYDYFDKNHEPVLCNEKSADWENYLIPISNFGRWYPDGSSEDRDAIKTQIMQHGPVTTAMLYTWFEHGENNLDDWGYEHHDPDEYYSTTDQYNYVDHCVVLVGWKDDPAITNGGYWIVENTMGPEWGYNGFFNLEYDCLNIDSYHIEWVDYNPDVQVNWMPNPDAGDSKYADVYEELEFDGSNSFDHEGEIVEYMWDFGDGYHEYDMITTHIFESQGVYQVTLFITDNENNTVNDTTWAFIGRSNDPPDTPTVNGQLDGTAGTEYEFRFSSSDPDGDDLYYYISWGDAYLESWIGPFNSGEEVIINHTWNWEASYHLNAKVKDEYGYESDWTNLKLTMPIFKLFIFNFNLLNWMVEKFPNAFPILEQILDLIGG